MSDGILRPAPVRVRFDACEGWFAEVPFPHPDPAILSSMAYALRVNKQRVAGMIAGARRDECVRGLEQLEAALNERRPIKQVVVTKPGHDAPVVYDIDARRAARG